MRSRGLFLVGFLALVNFALAAQVIQTSGETYSWQQFATIYDVDSETGVDGGCEDGIDNDGDELIDCLDPDCAGEAPCETMAPVLPPSGLLLLSLGLFALAVHRLSRARA